LPKAHTTEGCGGRRFKAEPAAEGPLGRKETGIIMGVERHLTSVLALMKKGERQGWLVHRDVDELREDINKGNCFLYEAGGRIVGMVFLSIYSKRLAEVRSLYVEPGHRANGAGSALVAKAVEKAKERGINEVLAIAKKDKESWFRNQGFTQELHGFRIPLFLRAADF